MGGSLKFHVMSKRPGFKASDISWVGAHQEGNDTGALGSVEPLGQQQQELTDAQRKSIISQFEKVGAEVENRGREASYLDFRSKGVRLIAAGKDSATIAP